MVHVELLEAVRKAVSVLGADPTRVVLEHPADLSHGDFSTNAALQIAKELKTSPRAAADLLVAEIIKVQPATVDRIDIAGPGFINFYLTRDTFVHMTTDVAAVGPAWGKNALLAGKKVIVEYSQPNPFKVFHIGHLMSTVVGESISRLVENAGATTHRANYQGDIGLHIAKAIWGVQKTGKDPHSVDALGESYVFGATAYEDDAEAKKEIDELNLKLYAKDPAYQLIYDAGRAASLAKFEELYAILGTKFDSYFFESAVAQTAVDIVQAALSKGIFEESNGAIVYKGEKVGLHTRVFISGKGAPMYEAKELALVQAKQAVFPYDLNITTIAVEQDQYFKVVEAALAEVWPELAGKYTHVAFGMMLLPTGKMASRKGTVITGESLVEGMRSAALKKMEDRDLGDQKEKIADEVAVAAIKFSILKQGTGKNIIFDPAAALSFEGDSGPYLQYAYTRALSVLAKAKNEKIQASGAMASVEPIALERILYRFSEVVERATVENEPHYITTFLVEIAGLFNSWYASEKIVDPVDPHSPYKVALTEAFAHTMKNGLWLLGISTLDRM